MFSALNHVGFNITKTKLQLVEVVKEKAKFCLENVDEEPFENEFDFNDEMNFINILQTAFTSLANRNILKSKNFSFSIPVSLFKFFKIPFEPSLSPSALKKHLGWEFEILFPTLNKNDYILQHLQLARIENTPSILVAAIRKNIATSIFNFGKQNNLQLKNIDSAHFCSDSLIDKEKTLSLYIEGHRVSIAFYLNGNLLTFKHNKSFSDITDFANIVLNFIEETNIAYNSVHIAGAEDVYEFKTHLEKTLNTSVKISNPFEVIETSETFIQNGYFLNSPNSFTAAAGICYRKF